jgi:hypothetical protein
MARVAGTLPESRSHLMAPVEVPMKVRRLCGVGITALLASNACTSESGANGSDEPLDPTSSDTVVAPSGPGSMTAAPSSNPVPASSPAAAGGGGGTPNTPPAINPEADGGDGPDATDPLPSGQAGASGADAGGSGTTPDATTGGADAGTGGQTASAGAESAGGASGGSGGVTVDGSLFTVESTLASDVDPEAPGTIGIVTWSLGVGEVTEAFIEFGLDTEYGARAPVDLMESDYRTLLLGMKPERTYHFRVVATADGTTYASDDYTVETGPPCTLVDLGSFEVQDAAAQERGFIVTSYWQGQSGPVPFILDADGEIVWWYASNSNGIARARMSADGKNMWMVVASNDGGPIERVSMDTLDGQVYTETTASHDITPVSGELMAFLEYGESDCDSIFEIDPSGETREVFETEGVVTGMCHANAVRYSEAEDFYTLSDVNTDVFVINRSGELQWQLSERLPEGNGAWGGTQHGHHLLQDSMLIFANRFGGNNSSGAVEYSFEGEELMRYESGNFSANLGDVQRLPGGNTLVTFSNDSVIHEVDGAGNVVLEIDGGGDALGYALWVEELYGPPPDIAD